MIFNVNIKILNVPEYAMGKRYIVANLVDGAFWFYGADDRRSWAVDAVDFLGEHAVMFDMEA